MMFVHSYVCAYLHCDGATGTDAGGGCEGRSSHCQAVQPTVDVARGRGDQNVLGGQGGNAALDDETPNTAAVARSGWWWMGE